MSKKCVMSLSAVCAAYAIFFSALHVMLLFDLPAWVGLTVGLSMIAAAAVVLFSLKLKLGTAIAAVAVNACANGIMLSSLFVYLGTKPVPWHSAVLFFVMCLLSVLYCLSTRFGLVQHHYVVAISMFVSAVAACGALCLGFTRIPVFAAALLALPTMTAFLISLVMTADNKKVQLKNIFYCSFSTLFVVILIVGSILYALSSGQICSEFFNETLGLGRGITYDPYRFTVEQQMD